MRKKLIASAIPMLSLLCLTAQAQTVDELVKKNIQARGGLEKIKAIKTFKASGKIVQSGLEIPIVIQKKRPGSFRFEITFQGKSQIQGYDGVTGWKIDPIQGSSEPEKLTEEEMKDARELADIDGALVDYKEKGHTIELVGKEDVEGTPAYKLKVTLKNGDVRYHYLDVENSLEIKESSKRKSPAGELEVDSYPGNYKSVAGTMLPFSTEHKVKGQTLYTLTLDNVETDVTLEDSIFKMPAKSADKPKSE